MVYWSRAMYLMTTGEVITAEHAQAWGLFERVVPRAEFELVWRSLARSMAEVPRASLAGIDEANDRATSNRTEDGEHLRSLESRTSLAEAGSIELAAQMSDLVDVDFAKAISDFQNNQTALSAAMKTYSQISKMSLFDYL